MKNLFSNYLLLITFSSYYVIANQSINLTQRQLCDLELIMNGGFSPLSGFMNKEDYDSVVNNMHLKDKSIWPIPIVLDVDDQTAQNIKIGDEINLKDFEGYTLAKISVSDIWTPNKDLEAIKVYGTKNQEHPGVYFLYNNVKNNYIGGKITQVSSVRHYDFNDIRKSPAELKYFFKKNNIKKIVAFQTRNPMHRAHVELTTRAAENLNAHLLLHPSVGMTKIGDIDHFTRTKCYKELTKHFNIDVTLSLLPLAMRMAGPREAVFHAIIRRNYGATHFIVGRDHAGPGKDSSGKDFYGPYDAQELALKCAKEIGIDIVPFNEMVYIKNLDKYVEADKIPDNSEVLRISGTQFRDMLNKGLDIPEWFSFPEVVKELRKAYPAKKNQGIVIFFTGLSGAGKSTIANGLAIKLHELQNRKISVLDGDILRKNLSSELGFSKEHRSLNVRRVGFVANEISKHGGIALCALIAPYKEDRLYNRQLIKSQNNNYIEVYISTPLDVCKERDTKGLYSKNTANLTGVTDIYEEPINPEISIDTSNLSIEESIDKILSYLKSEDYI